MSHSNLIKSINRISETNWDFATICVVNTALELDIFSIINQGYKTSREIAKYLEASHRGISALLDALVGMKLLSKSNGLYKFSNYSKTYLIKDRDDYIRNLISDVVSMRFMWKFLADVVKSGEPISEKKRGDFSKKHFPVLVKRLFKPHYKDGNYVADVLGIGKKWKRLKIIDIGTGSAPWGIAMAEKDKSTKVTAVDFPKVLVVTKEYVKEYRLKKQFSYLGGNFRNLHFGKDKYDLAILGHICHSEGEINSRRLIKKVYNCLKNNSKIFIADHIPNNKRTGPLWPLLFDLWMMINIKNGGTFTMQEYNNWLKTAGFKNIRTIKLPSGDSPIIIADKTGSSKIQ